MDVVKAIIPAAGLGTRFLPFTKAVPKEMLPLLNKPAIQYIVEEGLNSEVNQFLMITSRDKQALENHFDTNQLLKDLLKEVDKEALIASLEKIIRTAHFSYIRQPEPLGLGHAISLARHAIGKEYFGVMLPDDIISGPQPGLAQLIKVARQEKASVIAVQEVPDDCVSSYGIVAIKRQVTPNLFQVSNLVEKPQQKDAPSNLAVVGRYVLSSKIFKAIDDISTYAVGEVQLTDAISQMMKNNEKVFAYKVQGTRYDVGNPLGWIKCIIGLSLQHPQYGPHIKQFLASMDSTDSFVYNKNKNITHSL
ncbi:MAG TPA: UTP--glucose-1-phosphate uridylyltransferase [Candidatus Limnocylindria bacterium]|nr:UTP--glucose-1-phosphate uridylyltransferase [Candidatus Limnocylindria bacterium]